MPARHVHILQPEHSLLLVIDMQEKLIQALHDGNRIVAGIQMLMQGANLLRVPILSTTQNAEKLGGLDPAVKAQLPVLQPPYDKKAFSCMGLPPFASKLQRLGRRQILVCGVEAHICVCQTALDLVNLGYQVHVVEEAVSARTEANQRIGLEKMRASGVLPCSVEGALYEWLGEAGAPEFREILKLVKQPTE